MAAPGELPTARVTPFDPPPGLRERGPISPLRYPDGHLGWLVTDYRLAREVLADQRFSARSELKRVPVARPGADPFIGAPALPGWLVDLDPPEHSRLRRALAGRFTMRQAATLRPYVAQVVASQLDHMATTGGPVDLVAEYALPVASLAICELLGVPYAQREYFQRDSAALFSLAATADDGAAAMARLENLLLDLVERRRRAPGTDLLSRLTATDLDDAEIAGAGVLLLTAGHETTASSLSLATFALLCHPAQLARLRADRTRIDDAVEELSRYLTIFHFGVPRTPLVDVPLGGVLVRAGETVTVSLPAANRDPARFDKPDELDVCRRATGHIAFGYGAHQCLGQNLARVELRVGLTALFDRFPALRLAVPPEQVPLATDMGFYGVHQLPVTW